MSRYYFKPSFILSCLQIDFVNNSKSLAVLVFVCCVAENGRTFGVLCDDEDFLWTTLLCGLRIAFDPCFLALGRTRALTTLAF